MDDEGNAACKRGCRRRGKGRPGGFNKGTVVCCGCRSAGRGWRCRVLLKVDKTKDRDGTLVLVLAVCRCSHVGSLDSCRRIVWRHNHLGAVCLLEQVDNGIGGQPVGQVQHGKAQS